MSALRAILDQLVIVENAVEITDPITIVPADTRAYKYVPTQSSQLPELPAWFNTATLRQINRSSSLRRTMWDLQVTLLVYDADFDQAVDIAAALLDQFLNDLDSAVTLGGTVASTEIRGGAPTLQALQYGKRTLAGAEIHLDVQECDARSFS